MDIFAVELKLMDVDLAAMLNIPAIGMNNVMLRYVTIRSA